MKVNTSRLYANAAERTNKCLISLAHFMKTSLFFSTFSLTPVPLKIKIISSHSDIRAFSM